MPEDEAAEDEAAEGRAHQVTAPEDRGPHAPDPGATTADPADDVLPGDLVRGLVARSEAEIQALESRLSEAESRAEAAERAVRRHPAFALLPPDEVRRLLPARNAAPGGRSQTTTVVARPAPPPAAGVRAPRTVPGDHGAAVAPVARPLGSRVANSHWWWRIGVALVVVALLLLKFG